MIEQAEALDDSEIQERMAQILEAEDNEATPEVEETPEQRKLEATEEETEETAESEETEETEEPETIELNWNGENKVFNKSEVVELAQKGYDYTQKTQQLAEQRKTLEQQAQMLQYQAAVNEQLSDQLAVIKSLDKQIAEYKAVDWQALAQQDPMQYLSANQTYQALKESRNEAVNEYQGKAQQMNYAIAQQREQHLAREAQLMAEAIPELRGEKAQETRTELRSYLASRGFNDNEIDGIIDHRMVKVAFEAAQYHKLKSAKPEVTKRIAEAPKIVKGKKPAPDNKVQELRARAKKGDERAIQALIERSI